MRIEIEATPPKAGMFLTPEEYEFVFSRAPRLCVDCVLIKDGNILLPMREIEPFKGHWTLPGGMVRYKEPIDDAFLRITAKELGIKPVRKKLLGYIEHPDDGPYLHSVSLAFLVDEWEGELRGSDQGRELRFFPVIPEKTQPYQADFLRRQWPEMMS